MSATTILRPCIVCKQNAQHGLWVGRKAVYACEKHVTWFRGAREVLVASARAGLKTYCDKKHPHIWTSLQMLWQALQEQKQQSSSQNRQQSSCSSSKESRRSQW